MNEIHPAANLFPMLDDQRLEELVQDILAKGQQEPIKTLHGKVIDGRNRLKACEIAGIAPKFETLPDDINPWDYVWSLNGQRRDLERGQRYILWKECTEHSDEWLAEQKRIRDEANAKRAESAVGNQNAAKEKEENSGSTNGTTTEYSKEAKKDKNKTREAAASAAGVDKGTVARVDALRVNRPDLYERVKAGQLTARQAYTQAQKEKKIEALNDIAAQEVKAAQGLYDVIVMDPPWQMEKIERDVAPNQAAFDYPTMDENALRQLEIPAADDCHVWVWTTHKHLPMALRLLDAWSLKYVCTFVWHKPGGFQPFGLPQYNCEFALYARKGSPQFIETKAFPVCFNAPRGAHSEKPEEFYQTLRRVTAGRRLDMFNRRKIDGFDGWGNEAQ